MMNSSVEKTHYKKAFHSPYLSSEDLTEPTILTIECVKLEPDRTKKTKDLFNTLYFAEKEIRRGEKLKPMILNSTNSRVLKNIFGSPYIDDWGNIAITVFVDTNVKMMGATVSGLRINPNLPVTKKTELKPNTKAWDNAVSAYIRDGNFDAVEKRMFVSDEAKKIISDRTVEKNNVS